MEARHRALRYIDENLGARDLTAATISRQVGMSLVGNLPGIRAAWRHCPACSRARLEAAHVLLEDPDIDGYIADIAGQFGFTSDTHFSWASATAMATTRAGRAAASGRCARWRPWSAPRRP